MQLELLQQRSGRGAGSWALSAPLLHLRAAVLCLSDQPEALAACLESQCRAARKAGQLAAAEGSLASLKGILEEAHRRGAAWTAG